jgi:hypothetical protein
MDFQAKNDFPHEGKRIKKTQEARLEECAALRFHSGIHHDEPIPGGGS